MRSLSLPVDLWIRGVAVALLAFNTAALGGESERRQLGAHAHGYGTLDVVVAGDDMVIELRIPAVNVVGFEHDPGSDEERRAVIEALADFRRPDRLFDPSDAAGCKAQDVKVTLAGMKHPEDSDADTGRGGHGDDEQKKTGHAELHGEYRFRCRAPRMLARLGVRLFDYLRNAEELEARVVTERLQTAVHLRPGGRPTLELDR